MSDETDALAKQLEALRAENDTRKPEQWQAHEALQRRVDALIEDPEAIIKLIFDSARELYKKCHDVELTLGATEKHIVDTCKELVRRHRIALMESEELAQGERG